MLTGSCISDGVSLSAESLETNKNVAVTLMTGNLMFKTFKDYTCCGVFHTLLICQVSIAIAAQLSLQNTSLRVVLSGASSSITHDEYFTV